MWHLLPNRFKSFRNLKILFRILTTTGTNSGNYTFFEIKQPYTFKLVRKQMRKTKIG